MKNHSLNLTRALLISAALFSGTSHAAGPDVALASGEPAKRFTKIPIDSIGWCKSTADEFRQRAQGSKVKEAYVTPNQLGLIAAYWADTPDGASTAIVCFDTTALIFGQRNPNHIKPTSYLARVYRHGPRCSPPEQGEVFHRDREITIFWDNRYGFEDVKICISGVTSIDLSRAW